MTKNNSSCRALRFEWKAKVLSSRQLTSTPKIVATALAFTFFNTVNGQCNPSVPKLAKKVGMSVRTVQRALTSLKDRGYLSVERPPGRVSTNNYGLLLDGQDIFQTGLHTEVGVAQNLSDAVTSSASSGVTSLPKKGDSGVTTLKGTKFEPKVARQDAGRGHGATTSWSMGPGRFVGVEDASCIASWDAWLADHGKPRLADLNFQTMQGGKVGWLLPSRFAPSTAQANAWSLSYLAEVFKEAAKEGCSPAEPQCQNASLPLGSMRSG